MNNQNAALITPAGGPVLTPEVETFISEQVRLQVAAELKRLGLDPARPKRAALIASKGTLDMAYPPLKVPPLANPAMPVPMPNIIGMLPGMTSMATWMMKDWMKKGGVPTIPDLLDFAKENGVRLIVCQMSMDVLGIKKEELIDGLEFSGAAAYLDYAADADITLFV